ncbi:MFS transporter [Prescottella agglutinans]|uniref:MFS transporter n=1 Tax=Prescottella agglutinans TaxID=1644129 RepID=UPI003D96F12A
MPGWLFALLVAAFVFYTDDYVIAGVLLEISDDLAVSESAAGQLITAFSLTVAVVAPVAAVAFARTSRRTLFSLALTVFIAANLAASLSTSLVMLMILRVVAAGAAAAATPALFSFAAEHAPPARTGRYVAIVALGVTGSIAAGVPIGTWIGGHLGWRATFIAVALAGAASLVLLLVLLPRHADEDTAVSSVAEQIRALAAPAISLGLLANMVLMTGSMMMLTYLAAYLDTVTGATVEQRALAFGLSGIAGMLGIWGGGAATDRWNPDRALAIGVGTFTATMLGLWLCAIAAPAPILLVLVIGTVWGAASFWNSPAIQARIYMLAGPVAPQALALNTSGTYLGVAVGGALGGVTLASLGETALPAVAGVFGVCALVLLWAAARSVDRATATTASDGATAST